MQEGSNAEVSGRWLPVVDIGDALMGDSAARRRAAEDIDRACRLTGFFGIQGHAVPKGLVQGCLDLGAQLFALPTKAKDRLRIQCPPGVQRGYSGLEGEAQAAASGRETVPDRSESFAVGPDDPDVGPFAGPNVWPTELPELRRTLLGYRAAMVDLAGEVLALCALTLRGDDQAFAGLVTHPIGATRINHYPAVDRPMAEGQWRGGPHTDYGTVTILATDGEAGLEIELPDGTWVPVIIPPGAFLVNVGDLLSLMSDGRWPSTWHRVAPPEPGRALPKRTSIAHFQFPNHDAVVTGADRAGRPVAVRAGDHLTQKLTRLIAVDAGSSADLGSR
jgi:isopenicillin N synthase-like dioxygenase